MTGLPTLVVVGMPDAALSRCAAMLGLHPQLAPFPDLPLGMADRLEALEDFDARSANGLLDGLRRALGGYVFGAQDEVLAAQRWLGRRGGWSWRTLMASLAEHAAPRGMALAASSAAWRVVWLERMAAAAPDICWVHVLCHPIVECARLAARLKQAGFVPPDYKDYGAERWPRIDPQLAWYRIHRNLQEVLSRQPPQRVWRLHVEDLLAEPEAQLAGLCGHFGLRADAAALEPMMQPQRNPFAAPGPAGAPGGMDAEFMRDPFFTRRLRPLASLTDPTPWRDDRDQLAAEVVSLARSFGYR
ncbi:MAG TPA: sulfotransferase [Nevskiaceae bacterium]|nr:sulfotransferase [Nevskiaceae bacterium]